jgi:hypothetical protein
MTVHLLNANAEPTCGVEGLVSGLPPAERGAVLVAGVDVGERRGAPRRNARGRAPRGRLVRPIIPQERIVRL